MSAEELQSLQEADTSLEAIRGVSQGRPSWFVLSTQYEPPPIIHKPMDWWNSLIGH